MRRFSIPQPFARGYVSDVPPHAVALGDASFAQDTYAPKGSIKQRRGWKYSATIPAGFPGALTASGVAKARYPEAGDAIGYTLGLSRNNVVHFAYNGTEVANSDLGLYSSDGADKMIPRCVYNGELIICDYEGISPLIRYAGAGLESGTFVGATTNNAATLSFALGSQTLGHTVTLSGPYKGMFVGFEAPNGAGGKAHQPFIWERVVQDKYTNTTAVLRDMRNTNAASASTSNLYFGIHTFGLTWPAVIKHEGASSSVSGSAVTTDGITPTDDVIEGYRYGDAIALQPAGSDHKISTVISTTSTQVTTAYATGVSTFGGSVPYKILSRCPFRDATVHKDSLWGTGVKEYPNTVYVWPPTAELSLPPGSESPYAVTSNAGYANTTITGFRTDRDYALFSLDVPSKYDSTKIEALLSTDEALLVLKTDSVYAIYGTFNTTTQDVGGGLSVSKLTDWGGCIDLRSAISGESGVFWCGKNGIFTHSAGAISDITAGKVQREWRGLMNGYVQGTSVVTAGVAADRYLIVCASGLDDTLTGDAKIGPDSSSPTNRTLIYDIPTESWMGRMSNFVASHIWTADIEDGGAECVAINGALSNLMDVSPAFDDANTTSPADGDGAYPRMKVWSSSSLAQAEGVEGEARFCDLMVHSNLYDSATPTSVIELSVVSGGGIGSPLDTTKTLTSITGDSVDRVDRSKRTVNKSGRLHQLRLDMSTTDAQNADSSINELVFSFRDSRKGS